MEVDVRQGAEPTLFCGGGWYTDADVADACAELGYVDCTPRASRPPYLARGEPWAALPTPARIRTRSGRVLRAVPTTHTLGDLARAMGIRVFARLVSLLGGQRVTDTTSGFIALDRLGIELFAEEYPHDYPEVEATLVAVRSGLRLAQVQVEMRERETGSSSIGFVQSLYYMVKVSLALMVTRVRRYPRLQEARR